MGASGFETWRPFQFLTCVYGSVSCIPINLRAEERVYRLCDNMLRTPVISAQATTKLAFSLSSVRYFVAHRNPDLIIQLARRRLVLPLQSYGSGAQPFEDWEKNGHRALVKMPKPIPSSGRLEANGRMTRSAYVRERI